MIGHPASTNVQFRGKEPALYFSKKPTRPAGGTNLPTSPPPPKKKKKRKEKELSFFYTFQKLKKRHDTGFYYIHSEITADPCNLIGSNGAIYSQKAPFSSKLHLSPTQ